MLDAAGVAYEIDPSLVRGLDYYTRTVFEFTSDALGAQSGVGGGGRYDGLVEQLGGPPTPGCGWAAGVERIRLAATAPPTAAPPVDLYVALADPAARRGRVRRDGPGAQRVAGDAPGAGGPLREGPAQAGRPAACALRRRGLRGRRDRPARPERGHRGRAERGRRRRPHPPRTRDGARCRSRHGRTRTATPGPAIWTPAAPDRARASPAGCTAVATTAGSSSSTSATAPGSSSSSSTPTSPRRSRPPSGCVPSTSCPRRARSCAARRRTSTRTSRPARSRCRSPRSRRSRRRETPPFPIDEDTPVDEMLRLRHRDARPAPRGHARRARPARRRHPHDARDAGGRGLPGDRDADPHALDAGGRPRLPRPQPPRAGHLVRAAAVAAALQAAADDERLRALLPDRPLLPRRGHARRPPGGVHAARRRDGLRGGGRRPRRHGAPHGEGVRAGRLRRAARRRGSACPTTRRCCGAGSDRPDRRFGLEIVDVGDALRGSDFKVFESVLGAGGVVRAINAGSQSLSRSELDGLNEVVQRHGGKAVAWATVEESGEWRSPIAKFLAAGAHAGGRRGAGRVVRATCCCSSPTSATSPPRRSAGCASSSAAASASSPRTSTTCTGSSTSRCSSARRRAWTAMHHPFTAPTGSFDDPGADALARLRHRRRRLRARRRLDPHPRPGRPAQGLRAPRDGRGGGAVALRVPARRAALRRAAARRHRARDRPRRRGDGRPRVDPRRHRVPEDRQRRRTR